MVYILLAYTATNRERGGECCGLAQTLLFKADPDRIRICVAAGYQHLNDEHLIKKYIELL